MSKRKIIRKSNRPLNIYAGAGFLEKWNTKSGEAWNNAGGENLGGSIGAIGGGLTGILNAGAANAQIADTSNIESNINALSNYSYQGSNDNLLSQWNSRATIDGVNKSDLTASTGNQAKNILGGVASGAAAGASVGGPWGAVIGGAAGLISGVTGSIIGNRKAKEEAERLNNEAALAEARNAANFGLAVRNNAQQEALMAAANFAAEGGKIHIKPSKKGTFTAAAKKHGKSVQAFASQVLANKEDYSPAMVKKANFARNASKWHHAFGGNLNTNGADWSNGIIMIGNGGTHEENPMEGVQIGVDPQGIPNLVEEGEVIFNDYVFSNRLFADGGLLESVRLPKSYNGYSFAAIAEKLGKESEERPNDPISKRGLLDSMMKLQQAQEIVRMKKEGNKFAKGGRVNKFSGEEESSQMTTEDSKFKWDNTLLRYAPVVGNAIGLGVNLLSKPDYSRAQAVEDAANELANYEAVDYNPLGNYLTYNPFDRNFYTNKLNAQAGATRSAIMNTSSPSRNAALLAADYNAQGRLGDLARQAEEYNLAQRQAVEQFNRATDQANAEMGLKAAMANQETYLKSRSGRLSGITQAMQMRDAIDAARSASMSANMSNLFESLGGIGTEAYNRNMILSNPALYYSIDSKGNITYKNGFDELTEAQKEEVRRDAAKRAGSKRAKGGYLTIKRK